MKKLFVGVLFLCVWSTVWSQITITKNDMPSARDTARYSTASGNGFNFDTTGAGITWDYSALVADGQGIDSFRTAYTINPAYTLYFGLDDYGTRTTNLSNIGPLSLSNTYNFIKKSNSYMEVQGFAGEYNGIPIPAPYSTPDKLYQFPLTYGRMDTTPYELPITIPGLGALHQVGTRFNNVDGWGTVITPYDTFDCIRLVTQTTEVDSITIVALGLTIPFPRTSFTYQWLANGQIIPVLEVSGNMFGNTFRATSVKFRDNVRFIPPQFAIRVNFRANKTTCTTLDTVSFTNRTRPNIPGSLFKYTISPSTYSYVNGTSDTISAPQVVFSAPGLYTVSLYVASPAGGSLPATDSTTKIDYITVTAPTGIQDVQASADIQVYPNPVSDVLTVQAAGIISEVAMYNSTGQKVLTKTVGSSSLSIDIKPYADGVYLLDVKTRTGHELRKVVIQ